MADDELGSLGYGITGDFSDLQDALEQAVSLAQASADAIAAALNVPVGQDLVSSVEDVNNATVAAGDQLSLFGGQLTEAAGQMDLFDTNAIEAADSMVQIGDGASAAAAPVKVLGDEVDDAGSKAKQGAIEWGGLLTVLGQFAAIEVTASALKELAADAVEAFSQVQTATIALTAMTGSASGAAEQIENLRAQANSDALSFPSLLEGAQRMTAFGLSASQTTEILQLSADAAAATGNNFDTVSQSLGRLVEQGTAGARQLTQLGITQQQLAAVMGVSTAEVAADFKALDPTDRLAIASEALQKFAGDATLMTQTVTGQWNLLKNATNDLFTQIGTVVGPATAALTTFATYIVNGWTSEVKAGLSAVTQYIIDVENAWADLTRQPPNTAGLTAALNSMKQGAKDAVDALNSAADSTRIFYTSMAAGIKNLQDSREALSVLAQDVDTAGKLYQSGKISLDAYNTTVAAYGAALDKASTNGATFADTLLGVTTAQDKANVLLTESLSTLQQVTPGTADYARAVNNVGTAWDAANPGGVKFASTLAGIAQEASQQTATYRSLAATFAQLSAGYQAGTVSANLFLDVAAKLSSAAAAAHQPFASVAVDIADVAAATNQAAASNDAAVGAFDAIYQKYLQGTVGLQQLATALKSAQTAAENAGMSFANAAAQAAIMTNAAGLQIQAFRDDISVLGQFGSVLNQTPQQAIAAATALKNLQTAGEALGISVTAVAGAQNAFTLSTTGATPAVQGLVTQLAALFSAAGLTVTAVNNAATGTDGFTKSVNYSGVVVQSYTDTLKKLATELPSVASAATLAANGVTNLGKAAQTATTQGLNPFSAAAVGASAHIDQYTGVMVGGTEGQGAFSASAVSATTSINKYTGAIQGGTSSQGAFSAAAVGSTTSINKYTQEVENSATASGAASTAADGLASSLDGVGAAAKSAGDAISDMNEQDNFDSGSNGMTADNTALAGLSALKLGLLNIATNVPSAGVPGGEGATLNNTTQELENLSEGLNADGTAIAGSVIAQEQATLAAQHAAYAADQNTAATTANTTATATNTASATAAAGAFGNLVDGIQGATTTADALKDVNTDLGTSFTDVGSALQAVETMIGETSGSLKQQFENLASELNSTNMPVQAIAYSSTTAAAALQSLSTSTTTAAATLTGSLTGLISSTNTTTITQAQYQSDLQSYTDQVNAGTMSASDAADALSTLAQEALNAGQAVTQATSGLASVAAVVSSVDPDVLQKALTAYSNGTAAYDTGFNGAGRGAANVDAANQQALFQSQQALAAAFNTATGLTIQNQGIATAQVDPNLTYDPQTGQYTYAQTLNVNGTQYTGTGASGTQALQNALNAINGVAPGSTNTPGASGLVGQSTTGTNWGALDAQALGDFSQKATPAYSTGNPLPVTITNSQVPNITINVTGNGQTPQQQAQNLQQALIAALRQAGLKI